MPDVLLGSSSKWRAQLVQAALPDGFQLCPERLSPDIDEKAIRRDDPSEMVVAIAQAKTTRLLEMLEDREKPDLLICCDQVIVFNGQIREKPENEAQAKQHLLSYGDKQIPAICISGVVITNVKSGFRCFGVDIATQSFEKMPEEIADQLLAKGDIMYCAGSFVAEDPLLEPYLGDRQGEFESIQGMPIQLTKTLLLEASIN